MKIVEKIKLKIVIFTAVKNRCILHGRVFVMFRKEMTTTMLRPRDTYPTEMLCYLMNEQPDACGITMYIVTRDTYPTEMLCYLMNEQPDACGITMYIVPHDTYPTKILDEPPARRLWYQHVQDSQLNYQGTHFYIHDECSGS